MFDNLENMTYRELQEEQLRALNFAAYDLYEVKQAIGGLTSSIDRHMTKMAWLQELQLEEMQTISFQLKTPVAQKAQELLQYGLENMRNGLFDVAITDFERSLTEIQTNPIAHQCLGTIYLDVHDDPHKALPHFKEAARFALQRHKLPRLACSAHIFEAMALYQLGKKEEAYTACKKALDLEPEIPRVNYDLACYAAQLGKLDESLAKLKTAIEGEPPFWHQAINDEMLAPLAEHKQQLLKDIEDRAKRDANKLIEKIPQQRQIAVELGAEEHAVDTLYEGDRLLLAASKSLSKEGFPTYVNAIHNATNAWSKFNQSAERAIEHRQKQTISSLQGKLNDLERQKSEEANRSRSSILIFFLIASLWFFTQVFLLLKFFAEDYSLLISCSLGTVLPGIVSGLAVLIAHTLFLSLGQPGFTSVKDDLLQISMLSSFGSFLFYLLLAFIELLSNVGGFRPWTETSWQVYVVAIIFALFLGLYAVAEISSRKGLSSSRKKYFASEQERLQSQIEKVKNGDLQVLQWK